jgi:hypothetical protein
MGLRLSSIRSYHKYFFDDQVIPERRADDSAFEEHEVYAVDVVASTGEGKAREMDVRTTVFKKSVDQSYQLKMKASRQFFSEVSQKFPYMPFSLRLSYYSIL